MNRDDYQKLIYLLDKFSNEENHRAELAAELHKGQNTYLGFLNDNMEALGAQIAAIKRLAGARLQSIT